MDVSLWPAIIVENAMDIPVSLLFSQKATSISLNVHSTCEQSLSTLNPFEPMDIQLLAPGTEPKEQIFDFEACRVIAATSNDHHPMLTIRPQVVVINSTNCALKFTPTDGRGNALVAEDELSLLSGDGAGWSVPVCLHKEAKKRSITADVSSWLSSKLSRRSSEDISNSAKQALVARLSCSFRVSLADEGYEWTEEIAVILPKIPLLLTPDGKLEIPELQTSSTAPNTPERLYPAPSTTTHRRRLLMRHRGFHHKMLTFTMTQTHKCIHIMFFVDHQPPVIIHNQWEHVLGFRNMSFPSDPEGVGSNYYLEYDWALQVSTKQQILREDSTEEDSESDNRDTESDTKLLRDWLESTEQLAPAVLQVEDDILTYVNAFIRPMLDALEGEVASSSAVSDKESYPHSGAWSVSVFESTAITKQRKVYIERLEISNIQVTITARVSIPVLNSFDGTPLHFGSTEMREVFSFPDQLYKDLAADYVADTIVRSPMLLMSLNIIGNPAGFLRSFGQGVRDLVEIPLAASRNGYSPWLLTKGVNQAVLVRTSLASIQAVEESLKESTVFDLGIKAPTSVEWLRFRLPPRQRRNFSHQLRLLLANDAILSHTKIFGKYLESFEASDNSSRIRFAVRAAEKHNWELVNKMETNENAEVPGGVDSNVGSDYSAAPNLFRLMKLVRETQCEMEVVKPVLDELEVMRLCRGFGMMSSVNPKDFNFDVLHAREFDDEFIRFLRYELLESACPDLFRSPPFVTTTLETES
ncbi:Vacuolar protein sorting-associated protein [Phytophthora cinnamomi]|uniref:Vacuolar protein sorting-associated protein n=1 Tax=Phytophthora cinnamomi TaxID=4785 RepID=UPI00355ABB70|nr:Vacuolar protein sorting-associated protein [Phytophthora cinnamomi]